MSEEKPVSDWATDFDIFSPEYTEQPEPVWKELHHRCPVAHTERGGGLWMSTKYEDARTLCAMPESMSNRQVSIVPLREGTDLLADYHTQTLPPVSSGAGWAMALLVTTIEIVRRRVRMARPPWRTPRGKSDQPCASLSERQRIYWSNLGCG